MYPGPNVPRHGKSLYKPYNTWAFSKLFLGFCIFDHEILTCRSLVRAAVRCLKEHGKLQLGCPVKLVEQGREVSDYIYCIYIYLNFEYIYI